MWIITTHDDKVAITSCTMKGYEIGCNKPGCRKEWKTERGAREALRRIGLINSRGAEALYVHQVS